MWNKLLSLLKLVARLGGLNRLFGDPLSGDPLSGDPLSGDPLFGDPITIRFFIAHAPRTFGPHQRVYDGSFELSSQELNLTRIQGVIREIVEKQHLPDGHGFPEYADLRIFHVTAKGGLDDMTRFDQRLSRKDAQSLRENSPIPHVNNIVDIAAIYVDHVVPQIPPGVNLAQHVRDQTIHRAKRAAAPSERAKDVKGRLRNALNDHLVVSVMARPVDDIVPDPSIFSPPLAYLSQALNEPQPVTDPHILDMVTELFSVAAAIYDSEDARYKAIAPVIEKLFGVDLDPEERHPAAHGRKRQRRELGVPPGARADAAMIATVRQGVDAYPILVFELEEELGLGGVGDFQVSMTHIVKNIAQTSNDIRDNTPCATIFVSVSGGLSPAIHLACGLLADIYIAKPINYDSRHWFPLVGTTSAQQRANIDILARIVPAVRDAIQNLRSTATRPAPYLPNPTPANPSGQTFLRDLQFHDRLSRDTPPSLYRASVLGRSVLVKFCDDYDPRAHDRLARHNLAPELLRVEDLVGGLKMVVMAFDPETTTAYDKYFGRELPESVREDVARALNILHTGDPNSDDDAALVHGDVRRENILVPRNPDQATPIQLVGFRWSGEAGRVRYPCDLLLDEVRGKVEGLRANGRILADHDMLMCARMLRQYD